MVSLRLVLPTGRVREISVSQDDSYLQVLFEQGLTLDKPVCAGLGLCAHCRVRFADNPPAPLPEEMMRLGPSDVAAGWRLACRHRVVEPSCIEVPDLPQAVSSFTPSGGALAVDIGTTRIKWALSDGLIHSVEHASINPQMGAGSEVMSRIRYALSSSRAAAYMRQVLVDGLRSIVAETGAHRLAVSGNTTMLAFLLGASVHRLAMVPYSAPVSGGAVLHVADDLPPAYVPPVLGPFIGADISAGLAYLCGRSEVVYPFLLADLGTNGEFVLAVGPRSFLATSVPMGPAIEGVGLCCGAPAGQDIASRFTLTPSGVSWNPSTLRGISGTGYISLLAILRRVGLVAPSGHFSAALTPLGRKMESSLTEDHLGRVFRLADEVFLAERDVEEFLKVKAGINAAVRALLEAAELPPAAVRQVYLAGALGEYSETRALFDLGMLPRIFEGRIKVAGNTSLAGTLQALDRSDVRAWLAMLPPWVRIVDLVARPDFASVFMQAMRFEWI